ncbi:MAG: glycosyltransferase [Acidobacteria bacterium]|nr:glycosyltransferase [Acidobacteriota bacterium]
MAGGSERQAAQLSQLLHEGSRYQVFVACLDPSGDWGKELNRIGIKEVPSFKFYSFYSFGFVKQLFRFIRYLRERKIDIIHTHDFYTNVFGMIGATLAGVHVRIASKRETEGWRTPSQQAVEKYSYRFAHAILVNAKAVRAHLIKGGIRADKIATVYNGLDLNRITSHMSRDEIALLLNLPGGNNQRYITILANLLHPVKDHPTFLRAAQLVKQSVPDARFIIAGEGPLQEQTKLFAEELGLSNDVLFTGICKHVAELLSISEICVLSSKSEGFSNSILEYMGAGRPVVATDVGGARESIIEGKTGYLVQPGDHQMMASRIIDLLSNPEEARRMGQLGRQIVEQKFSCQAQVDSIERLYARLLSGDKLNETDQIETVFN